MSERPELPSPLEVDRLVHEPARLSILKQLYVVEEADFLFLKKRTGLTQGNLSSHMSKLETAGYLSIEKRFVGRRPSTLLRLTDRGRRALETYIEQMKSVLNLETGTEDQPGV